jgi:hypothetical protein
MRRHVRGAGWSWLKIRQLTDVCQLHLAALFSMKLAPAPGIPALSPGGQPWTVANACRSQTLNPASQGTPMNVMTPTAMTGNHREDDLMTRRQVAYLFRVTSAAVATWARRGLLPEIRNQADRPRYRRVDVEAMLASRLRRRAR